MLSRRRGLGIFWFLSALWSGNWLWIKVGLAGLPPFRLPACGFSIRVPLLIPRLR
jgi:hypothetical protein